MTEIDNKKHLSPYLNAKRSINDRTLEVISSSSVMMVFGLLGMLIGLAGVAGMIWIGSQSKFIPLVYEQDKAGNILSVVRADSLQPINEIDYHKAATSFIENIRLVTTDPELQRKAVLQVYAYLNPKDPSTEKANEYLNATKEANPFNRAANEVVSVEIISVIRQSEQSFQVDWTEKVRLRDGQLKTKPYNMRAILQIYQSEPTSSETELDALKNPHFILVRDFNWSKQI